MSTSITRRRNMPVARCMKIGRSVYSPYSSRTYGYFVASVSATYRDTWASFNSYEIFVTRMRPSRPR